MPPTPKTKKQKKRRTSHLPLLLLTTTLSTLVTPITPLKNHATLNYNTFPKRQPHEAAIVEWGNSAIVSALDAAVATFGPQTSRGAFFEVETAPILSDPIDGGGAGGPPPINADEWRGNMVIMTNGDASATPVSMAMAVQKVGGAALMIVNVQKEDSTTTTPSSSSSDFIYSARPAPGEEEMASEVDIPVIMVSLASGNMLTQAVGEGEDARLPDRVRLYAAADRPFFEDLSMEPMVYLIHNALTEEECDTLVGMARNKVFDVEKDGNILEGYDKVKSMKVIENMERVFLWKGGAIQGAMKKAIDERIESVSGYPKDHFSDFQVNVIKKGGGQHQSLSYDDLPAGTQRPLLTFTIFLNDIEEGQGGELIFPNAKDSPIKVLPRKGMAVVHQNFFEDNQKFDKKTGHAELVFTGDEKWVAKRWIYSTPVSNTRRMVLPVLAVPFGGRLPRVIVGLHDTLVGQFGYADGGMYFDKIVMGLVVFILLMLASWINVYVQKGLFGNDESKAGGKKKVKKNTIKVKAKKV
mmetsp:Transcript_39577/g.48177  ORF Transcript_39577/g.48177 Transcript_39577/m.48177 type:complete len:524 (-) Transcript_39577:70-1641(-)|eukprot:CAMPEP_0172491396 /NCGR_PEP_ID=MMETSP1066-20121228/22183_1 /TAXON_ID=671091 /ORGANISM="Coscinodiscus wailesii, Strain CCMP2513" /LENGTH=523 /DNA_ID=CAMNT_0013260421 /DNA_START=133 /DNA_END=1704 /DNA_ORIENTATION=+